MSYMMKAGEACRPWVLKTLPWIEWRFVQVDQTVLIWFNGPIILDFIFFPLVVESLSFIFK